MITFFGLNLFDKTKFRIHRVGGILFLLVYIATIFTYFFDYDKFILYNMPLLSACLGLFQAISAVCTFTFLPKNENSGYFGDKGVISYNFIKENIFYQLLTVFGACYYLHKKNINNIILQYIEILFVFFPYTILRPLFPTTHFSATQYENTKYRSHDNQFFYKISTTLINYFYLYGKHVMGFGFNYLFYKNLITQNDMMKWGWPLFMLNCGTVTISIFLHTLRFKKILSPIVSFSCYLAMAMTSFLAMPSISIKLYNNTFIMYLCIIGLFINLFFKKYIHFHYLFAAIAVINKI
jgi:hypothetical protein